MTPPTKLAFWLHEDARPVTPPLSDAARRDMGGLIRMVQQGFPVTMPHSRSMPSIGRRCHEFRVADGDLFWRLVYRIDPDAIVLVRLFAKKTKATPKKEIDLCKARLRAYDIVGGR